MLGVESSLDWNQIGPARTPPVSPTRHRDAPVWEKRSHPRRRSLSRPPAILVNGHDVPPDVEAFHRPPSVTTARAQSVEPRPATPSQSLPSSPHVSPQQLHAFLDSPAFYLGLYFVFNLSLTLYNKMVLVRFPFPWTLTALHALCGSIGGYFLLEQGHYTPARLSPRDNFTLLCFSVLYTVNIAVSNVSLQLVTVPLHQVVRASTPLFTILISVYLLKQALHLEKLATLVPVIVGVGFATYGDYYCTAWGLFLTILGTFLAALKTVFTNVLQTQRGVKLHPLDLLLRMSPLAFIQCVLFGWYTGELERVRRFGALEMTWGRALALLVNGMIAFGLNVVSFTANKKSSPLTMSIAANVKQVLTILLAVGIFDVHITAFNGIGILLTIAGGAWYAAVEYREKMKRHPAATARRMA